MAYLIPIIAVLLLVSGFVTYLVLNATRRSKPSEAENSETGDATEMAASDPSPLGDTTEHAGEQSEAGETVEGPEGEGREGPSERGSQPHGDTREDARPESERLANRHEV